MSEHDERVEALAKSVRAADPEPFGDWGTWDGDAYYRSIARRLLDSPAMRDLLAAERAKGLREAADQADTLRSLARTSGLVVMAEVGETDKALATAIGATVATSTARWLRDRADRIHPADPEETR